MCSIFFARLDGCPERGIITLEKEIPHGPLICY